MNQASTTSAPSREQVGTARGSTDTLTRILNWVERFGMGPRLPRWTWIFTSSFPLSSSWLDHRARLRCDTIDEFPLCLLRLRIALLSSSLLTVSPYVRNSVSIYLALVRVTGVACNLNTLRDTDAARSCSVLPLVTASDSFSPGKSLFLSPLLV